MIENSAQIRSALRDYQTLIKLAAKDPMTLVKPAKKIHKRSLFEERKSDE